ncbi:MAG: hypothetical protein LC114_12285 [Bryobacterales bacterium]|nr:hypothetical protein [Bryobacterales bacterium]
MAFSQPNAFRTFEITDPLPSSHLATTLSAASILALSLGLDSAESDSLV